MSNAKPNKTLTRSLMQKIQILSAEAAERATQAAFRCVSESIADARRQLREALG